MTKILGSGDYVVDDNGYLVSVHLCEDCGERWCSICEAHWAGCSCCPPPTVQSHSGLPAVLPSPREWGDVYRKVAPAYAVQMREPFVVHTLEGVMEAGAGDYLCEGPGGDVWPVRAEVFEATYVKEGTDFLEKLGLSWDGSQEDAHRLVRDLDWAVREIRRLRTKL